jgi:hypothetical protein
MDLNHNLANSTNTAQDYEERGEVAERPSDMIAVHTCGRPRYLKALQRR